jgi:hypothetical protein
MLSMYLIRSSKTPVETGYYLQLYEHGRLYVVRLFAALFNTTTPPVHTVPYHLKHTRNMVVVLVSANTNLKR